MQYKKPMQNSGPRNFEKARASKEPFWETLESLVDGLHEAWQSGNDVDLEQLISDVDELNRRRVFVELVKLDQEMRWSAHKKYFLEDYFRRWPTLQDDAGDIAELLKSECEIRIAINEPPTANEIESRFPEICRQFDINNWLGKDDRSGNGEALLSVSNRLLESITSQEIFDVPGGRNQALPRGYKLGRYQVLSVLGRGGMGIVYLAKDDDLDRLVAIKLLHPWVFGPDLDQPMLLKEARTAAKLNHASILPIYDFGKTDDGSHFVVMEYVEGSSLAELIKTGKLPEDKAVEIAAQVADALHAAHQTGFVHRDVKPANILIKTDGSVRIADFGLAVPEQEHGSGELSGTIPYMAPEQLSGGTDKIDARTDIWALGVVLYEMLVGQRPFQGSSIAELTDVIQRSEPALPSDVNKTIPGELDRICLKCVRKNPLERYTDASELADDLRSLNGAKTKRHWQLVAVAGATLLILATSYFWFPKERTLDSDTTAHDSGAIPVVVDDGICPWLKKDCKLVLNFESGATVDLDNAALRKPSFFSDLVTWLDNEPGFSAQRILRVSREFEDVVTPREFRDEKWLCWELPVEVNLEGLERGSQSNMIFDHSTFSLFLRFAVSRDGKFQVGTISKNKVDKSNIDQGHLLFLVERHIGIPNYLRKPGTGFPEYLPVEQFKEPIDWMLALDERQTILANYALSVYFSFLRNKFIAAGSEQVKSAFHVFDDSSRMVLKSYFPQPVTIINGQLYHQNLFDLQGLEKDDDGKKTRAREHFEKNAEPFVAVENCRNLRWSDLPETTLIKHLSPGLKVLEIGEPPFAARDFNDGDASKEKWQGFKNDNGKEFAQLRLLTKFNLPAKTISVLSFQCSGDNRNTTRLKIRGLSPGARGNEILIPKSGEAAVNDFDRSSIRYSEVDTIVASESNVGLAAGVLLDRSFSSVELEAIQYWSVVRLGYRYIVLGDLDEEQVIEQSLSSAEVFSVPKYKDPKVHGISQNAQLRPSWQHGETLLREYKSEKIRPLFWKIPSSLGEN